MPRATLPDGAELEYEISGSGDPLLLVMGTAGSMPLWDKIVPGLSERYKVVAYDHRGIGASSPSTDAVTMRSLAQDAVALLDALEIDRPHVLGWSLGTAVSQELAINHPDRVRSLVLYGTWARVDGFQRALMSLVERLWALPDIDGETIAAGLALAFSPQLLDSPEFEAMLGQFAPLLPDTPEQLAMARAQLAADLAHDTLDRLGSISCPTLVLVGAQDLLTPSWQGRVVADAIPGAKYELIEGPGSSHAMHMERFDDWLAPVLEHLAAA